MEIVPNRLEAKWISKLKKLDVCFLVVEVIDDELGLLLDDFVDLLQGRYF